MPRHKRAAVRDLSNLSGQPLCETLVPSPLSETFAIRDDHKKEARHDQKNASDGAWVTSSDLVQSGLSFAPDVMDSVTNFLLGNPNMNSSFLFRADILSDSAGVLKTPAEKERLFASPGCESPAASSAVPEEKIEPVEAPEIPDFEWKRTVVRRLIPRNINLDRPLEQTCHFYVGSSPSATTERSLYVYLPHVATVADMPFYHPVIRGLAYLYDFDRSTSDKTLQESVPQNQGSRDGNKPEDIGIGTLSIHIRPFPASEGFDPFPSRLERTLQALLATNIRLARNTRPSPASTSATGQILSGDGKDQVDNSYNPSKDNVIPRHLVQNTYTRLKLAYASDLCRDWVEETEPAKHVFEDLAITAFLIELWRNMYGVIPTAERQTQGNSEIHKQGADFGSTDDAFPGFVDVACGNGVLVYVLLKEGYRGWGFDARRRKTWAIFPDFVQRQLKESLYIPKPFAIAVSEAPDDPLNELVHPDIDFHTGEFPQDTFIISNHADELTVWTPLMAALASPESPLPFLSIPCCSHSLSGARYRYPPPKKAGKNRSDVLGSPPRLEPDDEVNPDAQPATGDLKALRAAKVAASTAQEAADPNAAAIMNSMYGSLTAKTMAIAEELDYEVEKTLLRIPSTRNMGVVGGRKRTIDKRIAQGSPGHAVGLEQDLLETALQVIRRECAREGGVERAARTWIQRAVGLHKGSGKGKTSRTASNHGGSGP